MNSALFKWSCIVVFSMLTGFKPQTSGITHPFFVSVTEISHNAKEAQMEISSRMFADDFENTLKSEYKTSVDVSNPKDIKQLDKIVNDYLQKHLQLKINGRSVTMRFLGFEKENESVWCYMQVDSVPQVKKLEVVNHLLYELNNTQMSIMHVVVAGNRKSAKLIFPDKNVSFEF